MLKKSASFVLASLRGSTYRQEYASSPRSLLPRWTAFLNILRALLILSLTSDSPVFPGCQNSGSSGFWWVVHKTQPLGTSEGALIPTPLGSTLPGLRRRKPSGILSATVWRPWGFVQFQLFFLLHPGGSPILRQWQRASLALTSGTDGWKGGARRAAALAGAGMSDAGPGFATPASRSGAASEARRPTG